MSSHAFVWYQITNAHSLRVPFPYHVKESWISFASGNDKSAPCPWKSLGKLKKDSFNAGRLRLPLPKIKAVAATVKPNTLALPAKSDKCKDLEIGLNPHPPGVLLEFSEQELDEREKLRRLRISKANKGNTPWNKGRKHSPETLRKIRERTRLAMQNPKVKMKLTNLGHAQTTETKLKIGAGVRKLWERRRGRKMVQESCCFEWQNLIAEASRKGCVDQEELQWNSYEILNEQLKQEWSVSVEQRKQMVRAPVSNRAPKSPEQRRKIAEAIAAKWADPDYRERTTSALAKYHATERKPRTRPPRDGAQLTKKKKPITKRYSDASIFIKSASKIVKPIRLRKSKSPAYKDPLVNSKLEMIKNIRAQRASAETRQTQAIQQARLLIAEAEKAAKTLEVAATKSPIAQSSLIETRKLIAEAIYSLESIATQEVTESESDIPSVDFSEENESAFEVLNQLQVNGHTTLSPNDCELSEDFSKFSLEKPVNGDPELHITNGCASLPFSLNRQISEYSQQSQLSQTQQGSEHKQDPSPTVVGVQSLEEEETQYCSPLVTKKWVRGRLVEVTEEKQ